MEMELRLSKNLGNGTLAEIELGESATVVELHCEGLARRRLLDLGLLPGTEIKAVMKSPLGSPVAYDIRGSIIALRSEDASKIVVNPLHSQLGGEGN